MFWFKKLLSQLVMPIPLTVLLLLLAALLWRSQGQWLLKLGKVSLSLAIAVLFLCSQSQVSYWLSDSLESRFLPNNQNMAQGCVVMVLGSSNTEKPGLTAVQQLSATALARLSEGIRQLSLGQQCTLVVSGYSGGIQPTPHASIMGNAAIELGVNPANIIKFDQPKDTIEEAYALQQLIGSQPFKLVTSATHMPRAMMIFTQIGMQPQAAPTDFIARQSFWWRLDADQLLASQRSIHEYVGMLWLNIKFILHPPIAKETR
ncbi:YdcF family protein [Shewanella inventionis]|uniref:YdcF family protein n=1 Tax=Shewanella inventionis TaxID=1738770 RepID=UPI001CBD5BDD|nr:ElyC/SanA/YdcF family protein [Shewanella inventionis]UAL45064.1 YdcF family protein [Shewanella inventionis]